MAQQRYIHPHRKGTLGGKNIVRAKTDGFALSQNFRRGQYAHEQALSKVGHPLHEYVQVVAARSEQDASAIRGSQSSS